MNRRQLFAAFLGIAALPAKRVPPVSWTIAPNVGAEAMRKAFLHSGEMVLPRDIADKIKANAGIAATAAMGGGDRTIVHIHAKLPNDSITTEQIAALFKQSGLRFR